VTVSTVGVQPASGRCGASSRTRCDAALESGGKCGLTISTRRMSGTRLDADAGAVAQPIGPLDLFEQRAGNAAVQVAARRPTRQPGFDEQRDEPLLVVHPLVLVQIGPTT